MSAIALVRIDIRTKNPLNGGTGTTSRLALSGTKKRQRALTHRLCATMLNGYQSGTLQYLLGTGELTVLLTRIAPSAGLDCDNLPASLKSIRDGVADYLAINDKRRIWEYSQRRGRTGEYAVEVAFLKREAKSA